MVDSFAFVVFLILVALVFDFLNGFHDSANAISTIVSTRVLSPRNAVLWAAFFEFAAVFFVGVQVANTIGTGIIHPDIVDNLLILAALSGAILWNLITWWLGLPSSSSHALIGGLIGAGVMKGGSQVLVWGGITKTTLFVVLSPAIGLILGLALMILVLNLSRNSNVSRSQKIFRKLQLLSCAVYCMGHGTNDAQKTMGIIAVILYSKGLLGIPFLYSGLGDHYLLYRHRIGYHVRRVAHCQDHGNQDHETGTHGRILCRNGSSHRHHRSVVGRHPCEYDSYDHRSHCRCRRHEAVDGRPLGSGRDHHLGLGSDDSHDCADVRRPLCRSQGHFLIILTGGLPYAGKNQMARSLKR